MPALLNYGEPQILELFKTTLPSKLYWILFSIHNLRDAVDAVKRVLTKEKIDRQLSEQSGTTTPFIKIGDVYHSNKTVSFNTHDPIREQSLTSMVYNMSILKKTIIDHLNLKFIKRKEGDKTDRTLMIEIDHIVEKDKDKTLDPILGDNHKTDIYNLELTVREEIRDIKIMIIEMIVEVEGVKTLEETSAMTDMTIGIEAEQEIEV